MRLKICWKKAIIVNFAFPLISPSPEIDFTFTQLPVLVGIVTLNTILWREEKEDEGS